MLVTTEAMPGATTPEVPSTVPRMRRPKAKPTRPIQSSTLEAYEKDFALFKKAGYTVPCKEDELRDFIWLMRKKLSPASIYRRIMAVRYAHKQLGLTSPTDCPTIRPLLRSLQLGLVPVKRGKGALAVVEAGTAQRRAAHPTLPVTRKLLQLAMEPLPRNSIDRRDRALLLLGFMGAINRSALVALNVGDISFTADAMLVQVGNELTGSKRATRLAIPITGGDLCAATKVREWLERSELDQRPADSPLFVRFTRSGAATHERLDAAFLGLVTKKYVQFAGGDPKQYSAHSLRAGRLLELARGAR